MNLGDAGLTEQPFRADGLPLAVSSYAAHRKATAFLSTTYEHRKGLGIVQGPTLAGKTTVLRQFLTSLPDEVAKAYIQSKGLTPESLCRSLLTQFGYALDLTSVGEQMGMLRVFALQQTASGHPPVIAIDDCQHLDSAVIETVCELADIRAQRKNAFRVLLVSQQNVEALIGSPELQGIATRVTGIHRLGPMVAQETQDYLHAKLYAAGAAAPADIYPPKVCQDIHMASGGWPGVVDRLATFALSKATSLPVTPDLVERRQLPQDMREAVGLADVNADPSRPRLYISRDGELVKELDLDRARLLIGRSSHNDLTIDSRFISRNHALLVCHGTSTLLMDLNSTNGTFVNSRRVSNHVMRHEDIVSLGSYRLKFMHPVAERNFELDESGFAETVIMKTLGDMRHMLSGESTQTMPLEPVRRIASGDND